VPAIRWLWVLELTALLPLALRLLHKEQKKILLKLERSVYNKSI
jgi:hypothetical protein